MTCVCPRSRGARSRAAVVVLLLAVTGGTASGQDAGRVHDVLTFRDGRITESSGLAVVGGLLATVNDSGDTARVFLVDHAGTTVGVSRWTGSVRDVEALAPGADGTVWLGDIGDNLASRTSVRVVRLPVGRGDRTYAGDAFELRYPDGPRDAESLAVQPGTGRVVIVSKELFGGAAYSPSTLRADGPVTMHRLASGLLPMATDAAFLPDGRHVTVRNYTSAAVYRFPSWEEVGRFRLPVQRQGEAIAADGTRGVYVSTEGAGSSVTWVPLPAALRQVIADPASGRTETTVTSANTPAEGQDAPVRRTPSHRGWRLGLAGGVLIAVVVVLATVCRRRR